MRVHLIGVGGVGMAGLAVLLKYRGHEVSGCDLKPTPRTAWLEASGVAVSYGHDPAHVAGADLVVVTPAVDSGNPEFVASAGRVVSRGEALARLVGECDSVAVCGSHGKTTTSTFTAKLLVALGESVEWAIGGETGGFPVAGFSAGNSSRGRVLVVEADESDGTLALYRARTLVVTNCEYDHPDHFKTFADYLACYDAAKRNAGDVIESESLEPLSALDGVLAPLAPHNRRNARAAAEVALRRGHPLEAVARALASVVSELPDRRFQTLRNADGMTVVTDYAHHPTEMACAVGMARAICRGRLRVLFQPHRYSRTRALLKDFPKSFAGADEVVLCPTYAAFERPVEGGGVADLYAECRANEAAAPGARFMLARSCQEAWFHARRTMREGDVTLLLGAGDIIALEPLVRSWTEPPSSHMWIGACTNTWRSDLETGEVRERTSGRASIPGATLGIPWMAGIPGTVGGWIKMNAGAFGHSISEVLRRVKVDGRWIDAAGCGFAYRRSAIEGEIQDFELSDDLPRGDASEYLARRRKFPPGTKGSVFKNPQGDFAGRLLETVGCKGLSVGGARVWEEHANVIVCGGDATGSDFLALASIMHGRVLLRLGVNLEPEVVAISPVL